MSTAAVTFPVDGALQVSGLVAQKVVTQGDAWAMAHIRNVCRLGFSGDQHEISSPQQRQWWAANSDQVQAWLYFVTGDERPVGFGMLRPHENGRALTTSCAVLPTWAGRGFGNAILRHLVREAGDALVEAQALRVNRPACRLHDAEYWREVPGPNAQLMYFRAKRPEERTA